MKRAILPVAVFCLIAVAWIVVVIFPSVDLLVSGLFYQPGTGFLLQNNTMSLFLQGVAKKGSWVLGAASFVLATLSFFLRKSIGGVAEKKWLFLLLALLIGPVLIANLGFKDHWGRARPREIVEFGGTSQFSPALEPQPVATRNGSFVSGDAAFGFYLTSFAYLAPFGSNRTTARRVFWGCMGLGACFGFSRLAMGAHFLSDILSAAILMMASAAILHATMFGQKTTRDYWRAWINLDP